ncbi:hypothetical protein [Thaumasiovibrio subtropicus]|uniref:hypothetical protein n=1 Tax=Thaumasiovibrio subtropicus TaxID=1891207 RepID=UPI000B34C182|nr:hypothetical protein [Thaumasiovibrio subtropicus]
MDFLREHHRKDINKDKKKRLANSIQKSMSFDSKSILNRDDNSLRFNSLHLKSIFDLMTLTMFIEDNNSVSKSYISFAKSLFNLAFDIRTAEEKVNLSTLRHCEDRKVNVDRSTLHQRDLFNCLYLNLFTGDNEALKQLRSTDFSLHLNYINSNMVDIDRLFIELLVSFALNDVNDQDKVRLLDSVQPYLVPGAISQHSNQYTENIYRFLVFPLYSYVLFGWGFERKSLDELTSMALQAHYEYYSEVLPVDNCDTDQDLYLNHGEVATCVGITGVLKAIYNHYGKRMSHDSPYLPSHFIYNNETFNIDPTHFSEKAIDLISN